MTKPSDVSSLFSEKGIKAALKSKGLEPSGFPTLREVGIKIPDVVPNDAQLKAILKERFYNEIETKVEAYRAELTQGKSAFVGNFLNHTLGQSTKEEAINHIQTLLLNKTIDSNNVGSSFGTLISKDKFDVTFDNQSRLLVDVFYKTTHQLAPLTVGALRREIKDKLGIEKLDGITKEQFRQSMDSIVNGIDSKKIPHK